ncbi:MAG: hypothetical protein ACTHMZ_14260 [Actinomycetes bacterium]
MEALHIPLGGARFRPCLEDFLEFLIHQVGFDAKQPWAEVLAAGRERWRRTQLAASVRDCPEEAARVLVGLGYGIQIPATGEPAPQSDRLRQW